MSRDENRIDIPDAAWAVKADFPSLETAMSVREEASEWINSGRPLYDWPYHTHKGPTQAESQDVEFIHDFKLPYETPCPCCTPYHPKYKEGFLVWFEQTKVLRFVGWRCFRRMNREAFDAAKERRNERSSRQAALDVLRANLPRLSKTLVQLESILPLAKHLDTLQSELGRKLSDQRNIDLWSLVRDGGALKVANRYTEVVNGRLVERQTLSVYTNVDGYRLVNPKRDKIAPRLERSLALFRQIPVSADLETLTWDERNGLYKIYHEASWLAKAAVGDVRDCRRFVGVLTVNTIKMWGAKPSAEGRVYMALDGLTLLVGREEADARSIQLSPELDKPTPHLEI